MQGNRCLQIEDLLSNPNYKRMWKESASVYSIWLRLLKPSKNCCACSRRGETVLRIEKTEGLDWTGLSESSPRSLLALRENSSDWYGRRSSARARAAHSCFLNSKSLFKKKVKSRASTSCDVTLSTVTSWKQVSPVWRLGIGKKKRDVPSPFRKRDVARVTVTRAPVKKILGRRPTCDANNRAPRRVTTDDELARSGSAPIVDRLAAVDSPDITRCEEIAHVSRRDGYCLVGRSFHRGRRF